MVVGKERCIFLSGCGTGKRKISKRVRHANVVIFNEKLYTALTREAFKYLMSVFIVFL